MVFAQELGQSFDEIAESLTQLIAVLDQSFEGVTTVCEQLEADREALNQMSDTVNTAFTEFWNLLETGEGELHTSHEAALAAFDELQQAIADLETQVDEFTQSLDEAQTTFASEMENSRSEADGALTETKSAFSEAATTLERLESALTEAEDFTEQAFADLVEALSQLQDDLEAIQSETEERFEQLTGAIGETHKSAMESLLTAFSEQLSQTQASEIADAFTEFGEALTTAYSDFDSQADELGTELQDRVTEILSTVADHFASSLSSELKDVFQDAIEDAVQAIAQEIVESLGMMQLGASITSALTPILPQIIIAKLLVKAIKAILTFGFG